MRNRAYQTTRKIEEVQNEAADLQWLAFLLTGRRDISLDIAVDTVAAQTGASPFFTNWMRPWARRVVVVKAIAGIRVELADSQRRTRLAPTKRTAPPPRDWSPAPDTTQAQLEKALLAIDVFPWVAVVLSLFEGVSVTDAATMLDADAALVTKARSIGLRKLAGNLVQREGHTIPGRAPALWPAFATH